MWRKGFRGWFYLSMARALVVSLRSIDVYGSYWSLAWWPQYWDDIPSSTSPRSRSCSAPLTVFMVFPFTVYVALNVLDLENGPLMVSLGTLTTMMASLLLCLFFILILVKRTEFHMNYRFILGFATAASISLATLFTLFRTTYPWPMGPRCPTTSSCGPSSASSPEGHLRSCSRGT